MGLTNTGLTNMVKLGSWNLAESWFQTKLSFILHGTLVGAS